ncbi:MAG: hypothetical protein MJ252_30240, partial [archaeon]|nr:hypothetical protein [archaeon]
MVMKNEIIIPRRPSLKEDTIIEEQSSSNKSKSKEEEKEEKNDIKKIYNFMICKYDFRSSVIDTAKIDAILEERKSHFRISYCEMKISLQEESNIKKFYSAKDSIPMLKKYGNYYRHQVMYLAKPTLRRTYYNELLHHIANLKTQIYIDNKYKKPKKKKPEAILDEANIIFNEEIRETLANYSTAMSGESKTPFGAPPGSGRTNRENVTEKAPINPQMANVKNISYGKNKKEIIIQNEECQQEDLKGENKPFKAAVEVNLNDIKDFKNFSESEINSDKAEDKGSGSDESIVQIIKDLRKKSSKGSKGSMNKKNSDTNILHPKIEESLELDEDVSQKVQTLPSDRSQKEERKCPRRTTFCCADPKQFNLNKILKHEKGLTAILLPKGPNIKREKDKDLSNNILKRLQTDKQKKLFTTFNSNKSQTIKYLKSTKEVNQPKIIKATNEDFEKTFKV